MRLSIFMFIVQVKDFYSLASYFVSRTEKILDKYTTKSKPLNFSSSEIESLTKTFMYENYVKARSLAENKSTSEVVQNELSHYPYTKRQQFQVGIFSEKYGVSFVTLYLL